MRFVKNFILALSTWFLIATPLLAKESTWYRVEVLVFEINGQAAPQDIAENPGHPNLANAIEFSSMPNETFAPTTDSELLLLNAKKKIQKSYRLVLHKGWKQKLLTRDVALPVHVTGGKAIENQPELDGIIRFTAGNFLHVDADLVLHKLYKAQDALSMDELRSIRFKTSSRIKANEVHYLDHPKYGMIVMAVPERSKGT